MKPGRSNPQAFGDMALFISFKLGKCRFYIFNRVQLFMILQRYSNEVDNNIMQRLVLPF
jgi:hypothetical protein